ncbi:ankyrin repeat domain-containing protein SOWAHB [Crotalus tigris]|uniref:ankyrin repeat domain-containing protein SOWAHB n=1 Tax=Crotalus tigris TaxID=88082 RepID=UPI00192F4912|nr:ankyrin repeat domain-containing protein SOWAHB [Crotalus tigris]
MARELSQAEVLDFLCQAGGRVANAALLGHFKRFLRDPQAPPAQLQHRRHLFKGFVNSVATVSQDGPGAATTYVVLRKRYRDLVGEEPRPTPHDGPFAEPPPPPQDRPGRSPPPLQQARWERAGKSWGAASPRKIPGPDGSGRLSDGQLAAGRRAARCPSGTPGAGSRPPLPASPALGCLGREKKRHRPPLAEPAAPDPPPLLQERAQPSNGLGLPVGEMGALPSAGSAQQRIRDWIVTHHSAAAEPSPPLTEEGEAWRVRAGSRSSELSACRPWGSLDFGPRSESSEGWREPPVPVFRSIRCQLSLQDLEDHLEQESSASEEGSSSASRESSSHPGEGETGKTNNRCIQNSAGRQGPGGTPHSNGLGEMPLAQASQDSTNGKSPPHAALLHRIIGRAATLGKAEGRDLLKPKPWKMDRPASPTLDTPLSPCLAPRQRPVANALFVERLALNPDGPAEHRSSLVPLDGREHSWLVKIATGSWMQVRALLQEDPQLVLHRDFISGFTVLHWLAKHGNAQVLQDFVTGAQEAGIALDVNVRSGCGYTPLHMAAIHNHPLIMKILVQKLQCRTQVRDSSGKKPWQYLSTSASGEIWQLLGGPRGRTIFPTHPIIRPSTVSSSSSVSLARKVSRKPSLANYLKPQHMKWKVGYKCPILQETEEYSD